jgi:hypothetical protein
MMLRLVSTGLCAACVVLLATFEPVRVETPLAPLPATRESAPLPLSVIDASADLASSGLAALVHVAPDERIRAINDGPLDSDLEAGARLASLVLRAGEYVDLTVSNGATERRVLVLVH